VFFDYPPTYLGHSLSWQYSMVMVRNFIFLV